MSGFRGEARICTYEHSDAAEMLKVLRSQAKCGFGPRCLRKLIPLNAARGAACSGIALRLVEVLTIQRYLKSYLKGERRSQFS